MRIKIENKIKLIKEVKGTLSKSKVLDILER